MINIFTPEEEVWSIWIYSSSVLQLNICIQVTKYLLIAVGYFCVKINFVLLSLLHRCNQPLLCYVYKTYSYSIRLILLGFALFYLQKHYAFLYEKGFFYYFIFQVIFLFCRFFSCLTFNLIYYIKNVKKRQYVPVAMIAFVLYILYKRKCLLWR